MPKQASRSDLLNAVATEHMVLQNALNATINEGSSRASVYLYALSAALVALGFSVETPRVFLPLAAAVIPTIFVLGLLTVLRLVDIAIESIEAQISIARIRAFYRDLGEGAAPIFAPERGRWPEGPEPSLRTGPFIGLLTTAASLVACVNAFVAGAGAALLAQQGLGLGVAAAVAVGGVLAVGLVAAALRYQSFRIDDVEGWREIREASGRSADAA